MASFHTFHVPVMGICYTLDTPIKVAHLGIDSVMSVVDDMLIERIRKLYCEKFQLPYEEIPIKEFDSRAKRIASYFNMVKTIVELKRRQAGKDSESRIKFIEEYLQLLPETKAQPLLQQVAKLLEIEAPWAAILDLLPAGRIDANIMTKSDKENKFERKKMSREFNDAHAALRGFAMSDLEFSSLVFSAGLNTKLFQYLESFDDFYPDENGYIRKKIVLKISDFRSAHVQGKLLAKQGLWVSEFRIESGLNCGGHAFASNGQVLGPTLAELLEKRETLREELFKILAKGLQNKGRAVPKEMLSVKYSAQGGVGTAEEHNFLLSHYKLDSVGWGSPFLLVPEVTSVDKNTLKQLQAAGEEDIILSNTSPYGIPFYTLKGNTKDVEKANYIKQGRPGSPCPKKYVLFNNEFTEDKICLASRDYQYRKIRELESLNLEPEEYKEKYDAITAKSCICVGLGTSILLVHGLDTDFEGEGVSICPGPNLAYFSKILTLSQMVRHIYGKENHLPSSESRPNFLIKEFGLYVKYVRDKYKEYKKSHIPTKPLVDFVAQLQSGLDYYFKLFQDHFKENQLNVKCIARLHSFFEELKEISLTLETA